MEELVAGDDLIFREHAVVAVAIGGESAAAQRSCAAAKPPAVPDLARWAP